MVDRIFSNQASDLSCSEMEMDSENKTRLTVTAAFMKMHVLSAIVMLIPMSARPTSKNRTMKPAVEWSFLSPFCMMFITLFGGLSQVTAKRMFPSHDYLKKRDNKQRNLHLR
ncbi:MAG: hypothetical protein IKH57_05500 [Clostridia bacterium]|nr:hypothetical protein [Clostridia bacterium]